MDTLFWIINWKGIRRSYHDDSKMGLAEFQELLEKCYDSICAHGLDMRSVKHVFVDTMCDLKLTTPNVYKFMCDLDEENYLDTPLTRSKEMLKIIDENCPLKEKNRNVFSKLNFQASLTGFIDIEVLLYFHVK